MGFPKREHTFEPSTSRIAEQTRAWCTDSVTTTPDWDRPGELERYLDPEERLRALGFKASITPERIQPGATLQVIWTIPLTHERMAFEVEVSIAGQRLSIASMAAGSVIVNPPKDFAIARVLYRLGVNTLSWHLHDPSTGVTLELPLQITVVSPGLADGWSWTDPNLTPVYGGEYVVGGRLTNLTPLELDEVVAIIHEIDAAEPGKQRRLSDVSVSPTSAQPGGALKVEVNANPKKWTFYGVTAGLWARNSKKFRYELEIQAKDEYGNAHSGRVADHVVEIVVPQSKQRWAHATVALNAAGWPLLAAASLMSGAIAVGATVLGLSKDKTVDKLVGAAGAKERADDPLEPDYDYGKTVEFVAPDFAEEYLDSELKKIAAALRDINFAILAVRALAQTEAKWLGARLRDDMLPAAIQRDRSRDFIEELRRIIEPLERDMVELADVKVVTRSDYGGLFEDWQQTGLPATLVAELNRNELTREVTGELASRILMYGPELVPESGVGPWLSVATAEVFAIVQEIVEGQAKAPRAPARV